MKNIFLPILALIMMLCSCNKEAAKQATPTTPLQTGNTCISGHIIDKTTGLGVPNVSVMIIGLSAEPCCVTDGIGDPGGAVPEAIPQDSTVTDANGNYNICFDSAARHNYYATTMGNASFLNDSTDVLFFSGPSTTGVNFILSPARIVQVHLQIVNSTRNSFISYYSTTKTNLFHGSFLILKPAAINSFDTTINLKALALTQFTFFTEGCSFLNRVYSDCHLPINEKVFIENIDTTRLSYIIN